MWVQLAIVFFVICLAPIVVLRFSCTITTVYGESMVPTVRPGDRLLSLNLLPRLWLRKGHIVIGNINQLHYPYPAEVFADAHFMSDPDPVTDDILAFESLSESDREDLTCEPDDAKFIKRIIGLPGDTVCIPLSTVHDVLQTILRSRCDADGNLVWTVPEHHCFVRGDGLISLDSLTVGPIPLAAITGIAVLKLPRRLDVASIQQQ